MVHSILFLLPRNLYLQTLDVKTNLDMKLLHTLLIMKNMLIVTTLFAFYLQCR